MTTPAPVTTLASNGNSPLTHTQMDTNLTTLSQVASAAATLADVAAGDAATMATVLAQIGTARPATATTILTNGVQTDLQTAWNTLIAGLGNNFGSTTVPVISTAPSAPTGSTAVAGTATAGSNGSWTNTPTQYAYQWYQQNTTTGVNTSIVGATASTHVNTLADVGFKLTYTVSAANAANVFSTPCFASAPSAVVTASPPVNTVAPSISPTGSQVNTTAFTFSPGTWTGASGATVSYQPTIGGAAFGAAQASTSYTPGAQVVGTLGAVVTETTAQGSTSAASSNTVTLTGAPALTKVAAASFATPLVPGQASAIVGSTWTGGTLDPTSVILIYVSEGTGGYVTPYWTYGALPRGTQTYTPELPGNAYLLSQTGLATLVGKHIEVQEIVYLNGVAYTSDKSSAYVVGSVPTTMTLTVAQGTVTVTDGTAYPAFTPVAVSGGVGPFTYAVTSPATLPPSILSINASTGAFPSSNASTVFSITVTVTVTDTGNGNATAQASFQFVAKVAQQTITPLWSFNAAIPNANQSDTSVQMLGSTYSIAGLSDTSGTGINGLNGSNPITVAPAGVPQALRFGKIADPLNPSRQVYYCALNSSDPVTSGAPHKRVEMTGGGTMAKSGTMYWMLYETNVDVSRKAGGFGLLQQVHVASGAIIVGDPYEMAFCPAGYFGSGAPNACVGINVTSSNGTNGSDNESWVWLTDNYGQGRPGEVNVAWPFGHWVRWIVQYRADPTGSNGNSVLNLWMNDMTAGSGWIALPLNSAAFVNGVSSMGVAAVNDGNPQYDYPKVGIDDQSGPPTAGEFVMVRSGALVLDAGYTYQQIAALFS